ncbi:MAG: tRNA pseudouridine(38-40) synthase TruA [Lentisphaeria bacterium]|nr:tRNA pseudouridine(38-40) synthase TruA [Lentisphaeria bacterium]
MKIKSEDRTNFVNHDIANSSYEASSRYLMEISFDGSNYGGWQIQPNRESVQGTIEKVLSRLYNYQKIELVGSSRTDAGVHAINFAAAFLVPKSPAIPIGKLKNSLNMMLPSDIKIQTIKEVDLNFHARFFAVGKAYTYVIKLAGATPFSNRYSYAPRHKIDIEAIKKATQYLVGTHDFSSFACAGNPIEDAVRTIYRIDVQTFGDYLTLTYVGSGFLYKMVRSLTGTLLAVGAGKFKAEEVKTLLEAKDRTLGHTTASAGGLFLVKVFYDADELAKFKLTALPYHY